jgi:hypothetical protein
MNLEPCPVCVRHVRADASTCPFCGAARSITTPPIRSLGRVSRAAVFASALGGCWSNSSPTPTTTETKHEEIADKASVDPVKDQELTKPPDVTDTAKSVVPGVLIEGTITDVSTGAPLVNVSIELRHGGQHDPLPAKDVMLARTDSNGHYQFTAPPGFYTLVVRAGVAMRMGYPERKLTIESTTPPTRVDVAVQTRFQPNQIPAPYGAPPARRRTV